MRLGREAGVNSQWALYVVLEDQKLHQAYALRGGWGQLKIVQVIRM